MPPPCIIDDWNAISDLIVFCASNFVEYSNWTFDAMMSDDEQQKYHWQQKKVQQLVEYRKLNSGK
jgi:hypothetical protein